MLQNQLTPLVCQTFKSDLSSTIHSDQTLSNKILVNLVKPKAGTKLELFHKPASKGDLRDIRMCTV